MNVDAVRRFCLAFAETREKLQWGENLCFKVGGKIFAILNLGSVPQGLCFKCDPERFAELTEREGVVPAPYLGRYKWVLVENLDVLEAWELEELLGESYRMVAEKLPRKRGGVKKKHALMATLNLRRDASKTVKDSIRSTLADSYVAAVAVIVLLIWTFDLGFQALWEPIYRIGYTLVTSLLILEIPDFSISLGRIDKIYLGYTLINLIRASSSFAMAWLISHWAYEAGPFQSLLFCRNQLARRNHV